MKKRLISVTLLLALVLTLLPMTAFAAGSRTPIYLGYADVDYMAEEILKEIPTAGKSPTEQIRAVYDWIIQHCSRYTWDGSFYFDEAEVNAQGTGAFYEASTQALKEGRIVLRRELEAEAGYSSAEGMFLSYDSNQYIASFAYDMMMTRTGNCAHYSALLTVLLGHLGFDCRLIPGEFVNNNGSSVEHKWNYVLVDGQYYWLDVRMDHASASGGAIGYYYFMKTDTDEWAKQHNWDHTYTDWLAANASAIAQEYNQDVLDAVGPWGRCSTWARAYMERAGNQGLIPDRLSGQDLTQGITRAEFASVAVKLYEALNSAVPAYTGANPFTDTADPDVLRAYNLGIVNGVAADRFAPDSTLTREQAVTMLGRVYELTETNAVSGGATLEQGSQVFADDSDISDYARNYIYFFVGQGIVDGTGNNQFSPANTMTCEQAIKVAVETTDKLG